MNKHIPPRVSSDRPPIDHSTSGSSTDQWQSFCWQVKRTMGGSEQEKDSILKRRIMKFFHSFSLEKNRYYVERREVMLGGGSQVQVSNNSILLYGIDFLSEGKIERYFQPYQVSVQYYDDSHCSVSFEDFSCLLKAVYGRMQKQGPSMEEFSTFCSRLSSSSSEKIVWRELEPYYEMCFERMLWFRLLTSQDYQNKGQIGQTALHQSYRLAKDNFFREIRKNLEQQDLNRGRKRSVSNASSRSRSNSNVNQYSRSRDKYRDRRGGCDDGRDRCGCHCLSRELKKFIQFSQTQQCRCNYGRNRRNSQRRQSRECRPKERENVAGNQKKAKKKDQGFPKYQNIFKNSPIAPFTAHQNPWLSKAVPPKRQPSYIVNENLSQNNQNDDTISSLVQQLQKYNFDEEAESFEKHMSKSEAERQRKSMFRHQESMDEETVLEIIDEQ